MNTLCTYQHPTFGKLYLLGSQDPWTYTLLLARTRIRTAMRIMIPIPMTTSYMRTLT